MRIFTLFTFLFITTIAVAQIEESSTNPWTFLPQSRTVAPSLLNNKHLSLNSTALRKLLKQTPKRFSDQAENPTILTIPLPDGRFQKFEVLEASNFHPDLAKQFPEIQAFVGIGIDDPSATLNFDVSPKGLNAMIRSGNHQTVFIEPIKNKEEQYQVFYQKTGASTRFSCDVKNIPNKTESPTRNSGTNRMGDCNLTTYRLALACTGEYADYHGGSTANALSGMNTTLTRVNGIYENDLSIRLELVANNTAIIFTRPETDPYSNDDVGEMLGQNQTTCEDLIGVDNFDIGHVLGTGGGGGVAYLGVLCQDNFKASGATGFITPEGDIFDIELVSHEIGHQFGANHTFNGDSGACEVNNRSDDTAVEVGSGTTIMSYAGICNNQNVQNSSDAYFHAISLQEIAESVANSNCGVETTVNTTPTISIPSSTYFIPKSTTFALTATGMDAESNNLTYTWEQMDKEIAVQPPNNTSIDGPLFRSYPPSANPTRYFPNLVDVLSNSVSKWEVLPEVAREMNFRGTVRENQLGGGCTDQTDVKIMVLDSEPFEVTIPNSKVVWGAGTQQTVTWNPGLTNEAPISNDKVDILLSVDGGLTYPKVLWKDTPNDGKQVILIPNSVTTGARIMVRASNNIFFDISNQNFEIIRPDNDFSLTSTPVEQVVCGGLGVTFSISVEASGNFDGQVELSTEGLPSSVNASFSVNNQTAPFETLLTISQTDSLAEDVSFEAVGSASTGLRTLALGLKYTPNKPDSITLISPTNKAVNVVIEPTFSWEEELNATSYRLEIAKNNNFSNPTYSIEDITGTSYQLSEALEKNVKYYWRVIGANDCGVGPDDDFYSFTTFNETCQTFRPTTFPRTISPSSKPTISSNLEVRATGEVSAIRIHDLEITHSFIADLQIDLVSPAGTIVTLADRICESSQNMNLNFESNNGGVPVAESCPPIFGQTVEPHQSLDNFLGESVAGLWDLIINDKEIQDGGTLDNWSLEICYNQSPPLVFSVENRAVNCAGGNDGMIIINPEGGLGNYSYEWSNGVTTAVNEGLAAGVYIVTVSDGFSSVDTLIQVTERFSPLNIVVANQNNPTCIEGNVGAILLETENAGGTVLYEWSNGKTGDVQTGLPLGTYSITATDSNNCSDEITVEITEERDIVAPIIRTKPATVYVDDNGIARIQANQLDNGSTDECGDVSLSLTRSSFDCESLGNQTVELRVTDESGNVSRAQVAVLVLDAISPTFICPNEISSNGCGNISTTDYPSAVDNCSEVTVNLVQPGEAGYVNNPNMLTFVAKDASNNQTFCTVPFVKDKVAPVFNCPVDIVIKGCQDLQSSQYPTATDNCGTPTVTKVSEEYTDESKKEGVISFKAEDAFGNISFCTVPFKRDDNLTALMEVTIPTCLGDFDGQATVIPQGGTAPYTYLWNDPNNQTTATAIGLTAGIYFAAITDATGCSHFREVTIANPSLITVEAKVIIEATNDNADGSIAINILGGTGNLNIRWFRNDTLISANKNISGLKSGAYKVEVTDENGCAVSEIFTVEQLVITTSTYDAELDKKISLFPNPSQGQVYINLDLPIQKDLTLQVYDFTGKIINPKIAKRPLENGFTIDMRSFVNGVYFVKMNVGEKLITRKILLLK